MSPADTSRIPIPDCIDHIVTMAASAAFAETPLSRIQLMDQLITARVRHGVAEQFNSTGQIVGIEPTVVEGKVTLVGACSDTKSIADLVRMVHHIDGVNAVENRIEHISFVPMAGV